MGEGEQPFSINPKEKGGSTQYNTPWRRLYVWKTQRHHHVGEQLRRTATNDHRLFYCRILRLLFDGWIEWANGRRAKRPTQFITQTSSDPYHTLPYSIDYLHRIPLIRPGSYIVSVHFSPYHSSDSFIFLNDNGGFSPNFWQKGQKYEPTLRAQIRRELLDICFMRPILMPHSISVAIVCIRHRPRTRPIIDARFFLQIRFSSVITNHHNHPIHHRLPLMHHRVEDCRRRRLCQARSRFDQGMLKGQKTIIFRQSILRSEQFHRSTMDYIIIEIGCGLLLRQMNGPSF